jgi:hypothetical protein
LVGRLKELAQCVNVFFAMQRTDFDVDMRVTKDLGEKMQGMLVTEGRAGLNESRRALWG